MAAAEFKRGNCRDAYALELNALSQCHLVGHGVIKRSLRGARTSGTAGLIALKDLNIYLLTRQGMKSGNAIIKKF